jgi:hypothetical protein
MLDHTKMTTSTPTPSLTMTVDFGPQGAFQFQKFLADQHRAHVEAGCEFSGYEFVVEHWPPMDFWSVAVKVGPDCLAITDVTVRLHL